MDITKRAKIEKHALSLGFKRVAVNIYQLQAKRMTLRLNLRPLHRPEFTVWGLNQTKVLSSSYDYLKGSIDLAMTGLRGPRPFGNA